MSMFPTKEQQIRNEEFSKWLEYINEACYHSVLRDSRCKRPKGHTGNHLDADGWEVCPHGFEPLFRPEHLKEHPECDYTWRQSKVQVAKTGLETLEPFEDGDPRYW